MKKIITFILSLFILYPAVGQIGSGGFLSTGKPWTSIDTNQYVTYGDLNMQVSNGGFRLVSPFSPTNKFIRKDSALSYVVINPLNATLNPKPGWEYVTKRDLTPGFYGSCSGTTTLPTPVNGSYNNQNGVYLNVGTNSGTVSLTFDTSGTAGGTNPLLITYGGQLLLAFQPQTYADTTVSFQYNYNSTIGPFVYLRYALVDNYFSTKYTVLTNCPVPTIATVYWGYTSVANDTAQADLQFSLQVNTGGSGGFTLTSSAVPSGVHYITVKVPTYLPVNYLWYNSTLSHGTIPDQTWKAPVTYGGYRYYFTNGLQSFDFTQGVAMVP